MDVFYTSSLYTARRDQATLLLTPDADNVPTVASGTPLLLRAEYILEEDATGESLDRCSRRLSENASTLLMMLPSPDGPPIRDAVPFTKVRTDVISWKDGARIYHGLKADLYRASTATSNHIWSNSQRLNKPAYFLTGGQGVASLWRILRSDLDVHNRYLFSISPVGLPTGLPAVNFSIIEDPDMRSKAELHWRDLQENLLRGRYYPVITAAKLLGETLSAYYLLKAGNSSARELKPMLDQISKSIQAKDCSTPFTDLDYHILNKIRILHARTHPTNPTSLARRIRPELAVSVTEDIVEVLTSLGLILPRNL